MKSATKEGAFTACMRMQSEWFSLRDAFKDADDVVAVEADSCKVIADVAARMAILSGQIAAFVMTGHTDGNGTGHGETAA